MKVVRNNTVGYTLMTKNDIKKIEDSIRKDGSLSEERKAELFTLLTTMKPEKPNS
jgi:hypothetical protein